MKLLIVEDEELVLQILASVIRNAATEHGVEIEITEACELNGAIAAAPSADVILCDGHFPTRRAVIAFDQQPWLAVYAFARPGIDLGKKRYALMTGDESAAEAAERKGITVFRKPLDFPAVTAWLFVADGFALAA
jgi:DNA-binding NarL/FixJ family response regulator